MNRITASARQAPAMAYKAAGVADGARWLRRRLRAVARTTRALGGSGAFNAVVDQDYRTARAALAAVDPGRRCRQFFRSRDPKLRQRVAVLVKSVEALRELRLQAREGVVRPAPTPEQLEEGRATVERLRRWLAGDDSAGPFE